MAVLRVLGEQVVCAEMRGFGRAIPFCSVLWSEKSKDAADGHPSRLRSGQRHEGNERFLGF